MSHPPVTEMRSLVIEKSINIEWLINSIISQHFFGHVKMEFVSAVLFDEYCSFALKRRILCKICPEVKGQLEQSLNRLNTIRNYFAHVNQGYVDGPDPNADSRVPDPRGFHRSVDFALLFSEFNSLEPSLNTAFFDIFTGKGGVIAA